MTYDEYPSKKFTIPTRIKFIDNNMLLLPFVAIVILIYVLSKKIDNKSKSVSVFFIDKIDYVDKYY